MSLVAREVASRLPNSASGAAYRANKVRSGRGKAPRGLLQAHSQRRAYASSSLPAWESQDVALLGSYKGTQLIGNNEPIMAFLNPRPLKRDPDRLFALLI